MSALRAAAALFLAAAASAQDAHPDPVAAAAAFFDGSRLPASISPLSLPAAARLSAIPRPSKSARIRVRLFDGARKPLSPDAQVLLRVFDGAHKELVSRFLRGPEIMVTDLPIRGNSDDNYRVLASARGLRQAGIGPLRLSAGALETVDLMLSPSSSRFDFSGASWESLQVKNPTLKTVLLRGATPELARRRYERLMGERPAIMACLLNLAAALEAIDFRHGTALEHIEGLVWNESMQRDRFFAYARTDLLDDVKAAAASGGFALSRGAGRLHPGAIISFKQTLLGEANVQLTFHHLEKMIVNGQACMLVEVDIDKYRGLAHLLREVLPGRITRRLTDPREVYALRWMAGRRAGEPEFDPLYTLEPL